MYRRKNTFSTHENKLKQNEINWPHLMNVSKEWWLVSDPELPEHHRPPCQLGRQKGPPFHHGGATSWRTVTVNQFVFLPLLPSPFSAVVATHFGKLLEKLIRRFFGYMLNLCSVHWKWNNNWHDGIACGVCYRCTIYVMWGNINNTIYVVWWGPLGDAKVVRDNGWIMN